MNDTRKILLAANCRVEQVVIDAMEQATGLTVELNYIDSIGSKSINAIKRHLSYIKIAHRVFKKSEDYQIVVFWQQFIGIYYALISLFLSFKKPKTPIVILTLIYIKRNGIKGSLHKWVYNKTVNSRFVKGIVCHSSEELKYYSEQFGAENKHKFNFLPIGEGVDKPSVVSSSGNYFFAGGTSNRDYKVLAKAFAESDDHLKIACQPNDVAGIDFTNNVEVLHGIYGDEFHELMAGAKAILITLNDPNVSAGQLVLLNAMRHKKVSIITDGNGMADYANKAYCLMTKPYDPIDLREQIDFVNANPELIKDMGKAGEEFYEGNYTYKKYGLNIGDLINKILM